MTYLLKTVDLMPLPLLFALTLLRAYLPARQLCSALNIYTMWIPAKTEAALDLEPVVAVINAGLDHVGMTPHSHVPLLGAASKRSPFALT